MNDILVQQFSATKYIREYHVRTPLIEAGKTSMVSVCGCSVDPCGLAEIVIAIPGVESVTVNRYRIAIQRARMFDWEEIEPELFRILESFQGAA